jgi:hypothetical protein
VAAETRADHRDAGRSATNEPFCIDACPDANTTGTQSPRHTLSIFVAAHSST